MKSEQKLLTLQEAKRILLKNGEFHLLVESVILNLRQGFYGRVVGYLTPSGGRARARVRTARHSKCIVVNWELGEEFNNAHYHDIFDQVFLHPFGTSGQLDDILYSLWDRRDRGDSWKGFSRLDWWHEAVFSVVKKEVGRNAWVLCEQAFHAAKAARDDPKEAARRARRDKADRLLSVQKSVRGALEFGVTKAEITDIVDSVIVESVMET